MRHFEQFRGLSEQEWQRGYSWLEERGVAFYLLDRFIALGIEGAVPTTIRSLMEQEAAENAVRNAPLFEEFVGARAANA